MGWYSDSKFLVYIPFYSQHKSRYSQINTEQSKSTSLWRGAFVLQIRSIIDANCHMPGGYPLEDHLELELLLCLHCHLPWPECNTSI